jgi:redox-sensitive bicupin YhaK (pirin superfamily)
MKVRRSGQRHRLHSGGQNMWLTFFPEHRSMPLAHGFGPLAALNEGFLAPEGTMLTYARRGSELITYVVGGILSHKEGLGGRFDVLQAGDFQRSLVNHYEHERYANASSRDVLHVVQLSLFGDAPPASGQRQPERKSFPTAQRIGGLRLVGSPDGRLGSLRLSQDARVFSGVFAAGQELIYGMEDERMLWLQVLRGELELDGLPLVAGDGIGVGVPGELRLVARSAAEIVVLDLSGSQPRRVTRFDDSATARCAEPAGRAAAHG